MKNVFLVYETDQHGANANLIGCFTAINKAYKEVIRQVKDKEGEISEWLIEFLYKNNQTQSLETNYIIQEQETNKIF